MLPASAPPETPPRASMKERESTWRATAAQCLNARVPGYGGHIPSSHAEDIYGRTQASMGREAVRAQALQKRRREELEANPEIHHTVKELDITQIPQYLQEEVLQRRSDKPCRVDIMRQHWVPTIPGYGGYIPGKDAENIGGGGLAHTCKMAARAIAERARLQEPQEVIDTHQEASRRRIPGHFHKQNRF